MTYLSRERQQTQPTADTELGRVTDADRVRLAALDLRPVCPSCSERVTVRMRERGFSHEWRWSCPECGWNAWQPDALRALSAEAAGLVARVARARRLATWDGVRVAVRESDPATPLGVYLRGLRPEERSRLAVEAGRVLIATGTEVGR